MPGPDVVGRFARTFALVALLLTVGAFVAQPGRPRFALGVMGGGVLAALSVWAIRGAVNEVAWWVENRGIGRNWRSLEVVKFFTK